MSVDRFQYLLVMAACLLVTLPLELLLNARVYSRPRRLLASLLPVVGLLVLWDIVAIRRGHWSYSPLYTTGWMIPGTSLPVEEVVFFLVVPLCGLLTYGAVGTVLSRRDATPLESGRA